MGWKFAEIVILLVIAWALAFIAGWIWHRVRSEGTRPDQ